MMLVPVFLFSVFRHLKLVNVCIKDRGLFFGLYVEKVILTPVQTHSNTDKSSFQSGENCRVLL